CNYCAKVINKRCKEFNDDKYITYFFLDLQFRNTPLKKCCFNRKKQGFDRYECKILCNQIIKYKNELNPFDLDIALAKDNLLNWWKYGTFAIERKQTSKKIKIELILNLNLF